MTGMGDETVEVARAEWEAMKARLDNLEQSQATATPSVGKPGGMGLTDRRGLLKHGALLAAAAAAGGSALVAAQAAVAATTAGPGAALQGTASASTGRGAVLAGGAAQVQLTPRSASTHPTSGQAGDLYVDSSARLWFCTAGGTSATWQQVQVI
jgi:hypothetical protein